MGNKGREVGCLSGNGGGTTPAWGSKGREVASLSGNGMGGRKLGGVMDGREPAWRVTGEGR